jgi:hypothetical protein
MGSERKCKYDGGAWGSEMKALTDVLELSGEKSFVRIMREREA